MATTVTEIANLALSHLGGRAFTDVATDTSQQAASFRRWYNPATSVYTALDEILRAHAWNFATTRKRQTITYFDITDVTNSGGLIKITDGSHGLQTGYRVYIKDVEGVTAANGRWYTTRVDNNEWTLDNSSFSGTYTAATGKWVLIPQFAYDFQHTPPDDCLRVLSINADGGQNEDDGRDFLFEKGLILCNEETINLKYIQRVTTVTAYPADFLNAFSYLLAAKIAQDTQGASGRAMEMLQFYDKIVSAPVKAMDANEGKGRRVLPFEDSQMVQARFGGQRWAGNASARYP